MRYQIMVKPPEIGKWRPVAVVDTPIQAMVCQNVIRNTEPTWPVSAIPVETVQVDNRVLQ